MTAGGAQHDSRDESPRAAGRRHLRRELLHTVLTLAALVALLAFAIAAAHFDAGRLSPVIAMTLSAIKPVLVALIFMRLARESGVTRLFAAAGLFWLAILFTLTFADYQTRPARDGSKETGANENALPEGGRASDKHGRKDSNPQPPDP